MTWLRRHITLRPVTITVTLALLVIPAIAKAVS